MSRPSGCLLQAMTDKATSLETYQRIRMVFILSKILLNRNGDIMNDSLDYERNLKTLGVSLFFTVLLSAVMLEIYLLISPVRDLHAFTTKETQSS